MPSMAEGMSLLQEKGNFSKFCHTRAHSMSQHRSRKDMHEVEQEPHGYFKFEQDSVQVIKFGNNLKGFKGNHNVLFDEIDGPQHILTDLRVQGASNHKDCNPVSSKYQGPVLKCRFKVDSGAAGNIIPYNMFQELYPNMPKSALKKSIKKTTHLVACNKEEIKQLGTCILKVNYGGKTLACEFFVVSSKFKPIIGLDASCNLGLLTVNCPIYKSWTKDATIDAVSSTDCADANIPERISKEWTINHPKYQHLFKGIGRFKCDPVQIKLTHNAVPVQKPP